MRTDIFTLLLVEVYDEPCNTGSPVSQLKTHFPALDFAHLDHVYSDKTSPGGQQYASTRTAVLQRGQSALSNLYHRSEKLILVVSHSDFMRMAVTGTWFANADFRVFEFNGQNGSDGAFSLIEMECTKANGGGMGRSFKELVEIGSGLLEPDHS